MRWQRSYARGQREAAKESCFATLSAEKNGGHPAGTSTFLMKRLDLMTSSEANAAASPRVAPNLLILKETDMTESESNGLPDDWDLEQRVFSHAGLHRLPDGTKEELNTDPDPKMLLPLIRELWAAYCDMETRALQAEEKVSKPSA
jgi:hypothetical protein